MLPVYTKITTAGVVVVAQNNLKKADYVMFILLFHFTSCFEADLSLGVDVYDGLYF